MYCDLPAVSDDCPFGPMEVIVVGTDVLYVPTGKEQILTERICQLIETSIVYDKKCGCGAIVIREL